ncbi:hypothetical protein M0805_007168 [Coniferiporia weirii]|nr:hypothetical protein M0805_007168 [Coniferiporia weirii]
MALMLKLPVGDTPNWETSTSDDDSLLLSSAPQSLAIHHSLRQSRNTWFTGIFPKFSSKAKGKARADVQQPPAHNLKLVAKADVEIGPHVFQDTTFYEAHYFPEPSQHTVGMSSSFPPSSSVLQPSHGQHSYSFPQSGPYGSTVSSAPTSLAAPGSTTSSLDSTVEVTPALIAQVNDAASSNPTLQNLLQSAAMGRASIEQLQTLGLLIQTLAAQHRISPQIPSTNFLDNPSGIPSSSAISQASQGSRRPSVKKPDFIIEFRENHNDRFVLPQEIVACEQAYPPGSLTGRRDIILYTFVPFINTKVGHEVGPQAPSGTATRIRIRNATDALWESIWSWVNDAAKEPNARSVFYEKESLQPPMSSELRQLTSIKQAKNPIQRTYLQHRLPEGDLLTQLRTASDNGYTMKSIMPSAPTQSTKPKRPRPRKSIASAPKAIKVNDNDIGTANSPDAQAVLASIMGVTKSASAKAPAPRRRKSTPKNGPSLRVTDPGTIQFINTIAPPPESYQSPPAPGPAEPSFGVSVYPRFSQGLSVQVPPDTTVQNKQHPVT